MCQILDVIQQRGETSTLSQMWLCPFDTVCYDVTPMSTFETLREAMEISLRRFVKLSADDKSLVRALRIIQAALVNVIPDSALRDPDEVFRATFTLRSFVHLMPSLVYMLEEKRVEHLLFALYLNASYVAVAVGCGLVRTPMFIPLRCKMIQGMVSSFKVIHIAEAAKVSRLDVEALVQAPQKVAIEGLRLCAKQLR
jgi:hypothetical protein